MSNSVPEGWKNIKFGDIAEIHKGLTYATTNYSDKENGFPFITLKCIKKNGGFSKKGLKYYDGKYKPQHEVVKGDVVFANTDLTRDGDVVGSPLIVPYISRKKPNLISMDLSKVIPKRGTHKEFIYYWLTMPEVKRYMINFSAGSTVLHLNTSSVPNIPILAPPLPEQKKIAAILTSVDTVIEKTQAQIDKLKDLKTGMMQELLTKGIGHTEFKDSPVGRIPVEWGVVTVLELGNGHKDTVQTGPFGAQLHSKDYVEEGIPLVLIKNIKEDGLDDTDIPKITEKDANRLSRYRLKEGDIVFSRVGRVGSCFLCSKNEEGWVFSGQTLRIRFNNSKVDLTYFNYALRTEEIQKELIGESVGSTRSSINTTILESLSVKLPPIQEQKKIASILQSLDSNIKSRELKLKQLMSVKKALMQDLLTGKVRVKV